MPAPITAHEQCRRVLVVDDEENLRHMLCILLRRHGYEVAEAATANDALEAIDRRPFDLVVSDVRMPGTDGLALSEAIRKRPDPPGVILMSAFGDHQLAIDAVKSGALDFIDKPFSNDDLLLLLRKSAERIVLRREVLTLRARAAGHMASGALVAQSLAMRNILTTVGKIAEHDASVLISGESGTGKERIARTLHELSARKDGPFIAINCAAIPEALLESELFGHARGAFTGANRDRPGLFESADRGTLLLDEVGELPMLLQPKLLRVLQESEVRRIGEARSRSVDVRIVAAGSTPLRQLVQEGRFRDDLYYRLNVIELHLPPLRERPEDIPPLLDRFLVRAAQRYQRTVDGFSPAALRILMRWRWPGNVRELENVVERAVLLSDNRELTPNTLPPTMLEGHSSADPAPEPGEPETLSIKKASRDLERRLIRAALAETGGNRTHAAKLLEISHRALLYKIRDYFPDGTDDA